MLYALVNEHGLNEGVLEMDAVAARAHPMPAGWRLMEVSPAEHLTLGHLGHAARHQEGAGWHLLPDHHVRSWNRARGAHWLQVVMDNERHTQTVAALRSTGQLDCLACCPDDLPAPPDHARKFPMPAIEVQPDLWIREMTREEADDFAGHVAASGLYEMRPDLGYTRATAWYEDALCWPVTIAWRGQPIEYETYHFQESRAELVQVGFNVRLRRDRPYQFWLYVFGFFFRHLRSLGITTIESRVRADLPGYINGLMETYGAERVSGDALGVNLRYSVDNVVGIAQAWPDRRTAGPGWEWIEGDVRVWEASPVDLEELPTTLRRHFRMSKGLGLSRALQILEDWVPLDGAAVILGSKGGTIRYARALRTRTKSGVAAWASLLPWYDDDGQAAAMRGVRAWAQAVGYLKGTTFVPKEQYEHAVVQAHLSQQPFRLIAVHDGPSPMYELEYDF